MLALCFMLSSPYYAENHADIINTGPHTTLNLEHPDPLACAGLYRLQYSVGAYIVSDKACAKGSGYAQLNRPFIT